MLSERIKEAREEAGLSQESLASKLEIGKRTLIDYEKGVSEPKASTLIKIADFCNINPSWLLTGRGRKSKAERQKIKSLMVAGERSIRAKEETDESFLVNYYPDIQAAAGYGAQNTEMEHQQISISKLLAQALCITHISRVDVIKVFGDSMEPEYTNGQLIVVERVSTIEEVRNGNTVIANIGGDIYIKKIEKVPLKHRIVLHSSNPEYEPIKVDSSELDQLSIVGVVKGSVTPH